MPMLTLMRSVRLRDDVMPLLSIALPLVLTGLMQCSMNFFENIFLARLGPHTLAAGALVGWFFATVIVILFGIFSSVNVLIAQKFGEQDTAGIAHVLRDGLIMAALLLVPTFILFWYMAPFLLLLGQSPKLVLLAQAYLHALAWGLLPKFVLIVFYEAILGLGHTRVITYFTLCTVPIYIFFSWVLIFGVMGFPKLGIAGAGWGVTVGDWISMVMLLAYVAYDKRYHVYLQALVHLKKPSFVDEILHVGVPTGVMYCIEVGYFFAMTILMGLLGIHTLAANQVTMQYLGPLMGTVFSIAQAITIRLGHQIGARQHASAERTALAGVGVTIIFMLIVAVIYLGVPEWLIAVDFDVTDPTHFETVQLAKKFFYVAALFQIFEGARIALFGALRGLKDTRYTLAISIISFWMISFPLGYALSRWQVLGGLGFWWAMVIGAFISTVLLLRRLRKKIHAYALIMAAS